MTLFTLPDLGIAYNALEPAIDEVTMQIHHRKHHQAYVDKLNAALQGYTTLQGKSAEELLKGIKSVPQGIRAAVQNNGGGHLNHSFFWSIMKIGSRFEGRIEDAINKDFSNFPTFRKQFSEVSMKLFGSGWVWLVADKDGKLGIMPTAGHENPIQQGKTPLLVIDLWEHAYYLKYQNRRQEYIDAFFNVINWQKVNELYMPVYEAGCLP